MQSTDLVYKTCVQVLKEELLPAMGCTEPIAIAYAAAGSRAGRSARCLRASP